MRSSRLTWVFAVFAPVAAGSMGCFLSTERDTYDETYGDYGTGDGGGCPVGAEGCPCTSGGKCNDPFLCNTNLNICISDTCPVGSEGCPCTQGGPGQPGV